MSDTTNLTINDLNKLSKAERESLFLVRQGSIEYKYTFEDLVRDIVNDPVIPLQLGSDSSKIGDIKSSGTLTANIVNVGDLSIDNTLTLNTLPIRVKDFQGNSNSGLPNFDTNSSFKEADNDSLQIFVEDSINTYKDSSGNSVRKKGIINLPSNVSDSLEAFSTNTVEQEDGWEKRKNYFTERFTYIPQQYAIDSTSSEGTKSIFWGSTWLRAWGETIPHLNIFDDEVVRDHTDVGVEVPLHSIVGSTLFSVNKVRTEFIENGDLDYFPKSTSGSDSYPDAYPYHVHCADSGILNIGSYYGAFPIVKKTGKLYKIFEDTTLTEEQRIAKIQGEDYTSGASLRENLLVGISTNTYYSLEKACECAITEFDSTTNTWVTSHNSSYNEDYERDNSGNYKVDDAGNKIPLKRTTLTTVEYIQDYVQNGGIEVRNEKDPEYDPTYGDATKPTYDHEYFLVAVESSPEGTNIPLNSSNTIANGHAYLITSLEETVEEVPVSEVPTTDEDDSTSAEGSTSGATDETGTEPETTTKTSYAVKYTLTADYVANAIWNDIADYIKIDDDLEVEYGKTYTRDPNTGKIKLAQKGDPIIGIASDTCGFKLGENKEEHQLPVALGGWVLAFVDKVYPAGTLLKVKKEGILTKASKIDEIFNSYKIVAKFDREEKAKTWYGRKVNKRHWVKVI